MENENQGDSGFSLRLGDLWMVAQMQAWLIATFTVVVMIVAFLVTITTTKMYSAQATIRIGTVAGQELRVEEVRDFEMQSMLDPDVFFRTQLEFLQSRKVREEAIKRYMALGYDDLTLENGGADALSGMLMLSPRPSSEFVDIQIIHSDADKAAVLANLIAQVYQEQNLESRKDEAKNGKAWIEVQLRQAEARIAEASAALLQYQTDVDLGDAQEDVTALSLSVGGLNSAYGELNTERVLLETTLRSHDRLLANGEYPRIAQDLQTPLLERLAADYASAVSEHAALAGKYGERYPDRIDAQQRMERLKASLEAEVRRAVEDERNRLRLLESKRDTLQAEIAAGKQLLLERQALLEGYSKLAQEVVIAKDTYALLRSRDIELELSSQTKLNNVAIVDEARARHSHVKPNLQMNMMLALVTGLAGGLLLGLAREYVDDTIGSPLDVATHLRVPYLGMVPKIMGTDEKNLSLYTHRNPTSSTAEALRALRTVLELNPSGQRIKRLVLTSSVSSEGKTSTTVGLGVAFANLGKRVLVIDSDLRRPRLHKIFDVPRAAGLSAVLLRESPLEECVHPTAVPGLDVMPSGEGNDHPNELLASEAMDQMLDELDRRYDLILLDTPPAVMLSDALILSKAVDGVVLVVREHTASRLLVKQTVGRLKQVGANMLGVVVNAVDMNKRSVTYKYYYGYRYRYDQYYQEDRQDDRAAK